MQRGAVIGLIVAIIAVVIIILLAVVLPNNQDKTITDTTSKITLPDTSAPTPFPSPTPESETTPQTFTIEITSAGFSPKTLEIKQGDTVVFLNKDTSQHWTASAQHPTHKVYPESTGKCPVIGGSDFDACKGLKQGESFSFVFNVKGSWNYHDHLNPGLFGTIIVN
ncbi:cupredoxin domain-containing protein [Candidatus Pacearchaeota archaeon]|nr:cupredoxin domain-containing protein [Candidatus Pacearchaeota archaeon]